MKNKGFTLIELLAVIVILAIIALIAVPIILNIIGQAKGEATERSKELYLEAVKEAVARKNLTSEFNPTTCTVKSDGNLSCKSGEETVDLIVESNGTRPTGGTVTLEDGVIKSETLVFDGSTEYVDESGANKPELVDGLTPVIYDDELKQWKIANTTKDKWYNYDEKKWANAVILSETGKNKKVGDALTIPEKPEDIKNSDVLALFVWVPRYEYKMPETVEDKNNPDLIDVNFVSKDENVSTDGYTLHPGFTFGSDTLSGLWVGKFETGHIEAKDYHYLGCQDINCQDSDNIRILPNIYSLRYNNVSNMFYASRSMARAGNPFNINSSTADTHMAKNSEWGAVAYLSHSKYGKEGEVYLNTCFNYVTGVGAFSASDYSVAWLNTGSNLKYNGTSGVNASTTGNVYGVYDMSGGASEYVMAYLTTASTTWGASGFGNYAGFTTKPDDKYFDGYTKGNSTDSEYKGHSIGETEEWYGDLNSSIQGGLPWFTRGTTYMRHNEAGVFAFATDSGEGQEYFSFRVVLAPTPYVE